MRQLTLPSGDVVGTGLLMPHSPRHTLMATPLESVVQVLSKSELEKIAKSGVMDGRKKFDESWVQNQRHYGSCNGFAGATALAKARVARGLKRVDLSGAYLYSLINGGVDRGSMLDDGMMAVQNRGVATKKTVPWNAIYPNQYDKAKADAEATKYKGWECYPVETLDGYWTALALGFIVVTAVHAGSRFMRVDGAEGVAGVDSGPGNHAVHADGLVWVGELGATGENSWDVTYGKRGRMILLEDHYTQPSRYHVSYAFRSTTEDTAQDKEDGIPDAKV